jgi:hypothetical protein
MQPAPSLLDWLRHKLGQPRGQRLVRYGFAGLALAWGISLLFGGETMAAFFLLGAALGLAFWGFSVRPAGGLALELPELSLAPRPSPAGPLALSASTTTAHLGAAHERPQRLLAALRLPSALVLAAWGQAVLFNSPLRASVGTALLALGVISFVGVLWHDRLLGLPRAEAVPVAQPLAVRWALLALAVGAACFSFWDAGGNQFRLLGVLAWALSVAAWLASLWDMTTPIAERWARARSRLAGWLQPDGLRLRLPWLAILFLAVLAVGAYFRFARLAAVPPEMTSDHVEKLLDTNAVLAGQFQVFFQRSLGREPLHYYLAALVIRWLDTGVTFEALKTASALAGVLLLPFVFWLGRELEDDAFGLLAMLLAGVSYWAVILSRLGLRFALAPLFVAPMLLFFLRGTRRGSRNDFLLAGLCLGLGLYGYNSLRLAPVLLLAAATWLALWPPAGLSRRDLGANTVLLLATAFVVFVPLYRYALEPGSAYWSGLAAQIGGAAQPMRVFVSNNWNALRMFNWTGDGVWVSSLPRKPALDFVTGALFVLGVVFLFGRVLLRRDRTAGLLLLAIPLLLLPSTLSLSSPSENPSVTRAAGVIPLVMLIAAYPLWLMWRRLHAVFYAPRGRWVAAGGVGLVLVAAALVNRDLYFNQYAAQYLGSAQNASEIGAVVRSYAQSVGSYERAWLCVHPHWADTRAVGLYAGQPAWNQVLAPEQIAALAGDPRPLLLILHPESDACLSAARSAFPAGTLSPFHSARGPARDFWLYVVPAAEDLI